MGAGVVYQPAWHRRAEPPAASIAGRPANPPSWPRREPRSNALAGGQTGLLKKIRRIVTGHNAAGKLVIIPDEPSPNVLMMPGRSDLRPHNPLGRRPVARRPHRRGRRRGPAKATLPAWGSGSPLTWSPCR